MSGRDKMRAQRYADLAEQRQARIAHGAEVRRQTEHRRAATVATQIADQRAAALTHANRKY
jgi:hypothetical protein